MSQKRTWLVSQQSVWQLPVLLFLQSGTPDVFIQPSLARGEVNLFKGRAEAKHRWEIRKFDFFLNHAMLTLFSKLYSNGQWCVYNVISILFLLNYFLCIFTFLQFGKWLNVKTVIKKVIDLICFAFCKEQINLRGWLLQSQWVELDLGPTAPLDHAPSPSRIQLGSTSPSRTLRLL